MIMEEKNLFSSEKDEKIKSLMQSIDNTNYRYGRSTLSLASAGVHKNCLGALFVEYAETIFF